MGVYKTIGVTRAWLVISCVAFLFLPQASYAAAPAQLSFSTSNITFPSQSVGSSSNPQAITLSNTGGVPIFLFGVYVSGDFSQTNTCRVALPVQGTCTINLTFNPTATGLRTGVLSLAHNAPNSLNAIALSGLGATPGVSQAALSTGSLNFGAQNISTSSAAQAITLSNPGSAALSISSITTTGDFSQTNNCGSSLAVSSECGISVLFTPTVAGGRSGTLTVTDNAAGSPHIVALSGSGAGTSQVALSVSSLNFSNQGVGAISPLQTITLSSTGSAPLAIGSIVASGDFAETNTCGLSLPLSASCTISVTFQPTMGGVRNGSIVIADNAPGTPHSISLSGTGTGNAG